MDELDQIFAQKKESAGSQKKKESARALQKKEPASLQKPHSKEAHPAYSIRKESTKNRAEYTAEGFRIYTAEELNVGKGGSTAECPFDCSCCF